MEMMDWQLVGRRYRRENVDQSTINDDEYLKAGGQAGGRAGTREASCKRAQISRHVSQFFPK